MVTPLSPTEVSAVSDPTTGFPPVDERPPWWKQVLLAPVSARTWREQGYLLISSIMGALAFGTLAMLVWLSIISAWLLVGVGLFALTLRGARLWAGAPRALAAKLLGECVAEPRYPRRKPGVRGWLGAAFGDVDAWRAVAFIVVSTPVTVLGAYVLVLLWGIAVSWATYPVWWAAFGPENVDANGVVRQSGMQIGEFYFDTWASSIALSLAGIALLLAIPWFARGVANVDRWLVRGLLAPTRTADRVEDLESTRAQAVDQSAATLRRIERDLHDGTQARLVALAMHLDVARESLADESPEDVARTRDLLDRVHRDTLDTIAELREVTRSIHPPALDRGLEDALATLAARSGVPTELHVSVPQRPSPAIETIAYYCAAELLTNVAKHARASRAWVAVTAHAGTLRIEVRDDGRGGAVLREGGGLAGLAERVGTVDGRLSLSSVDGGPTIAVVELPYAAG